MWCINYSWVVCSFFKMYKHFIFLCKRFYIHVILFNTCFWNSHLMILLVLFWFPSFGDSMLVFWLNPLALFPHLLAIGEGWNVDGLVNLQHLLAKINNFIVTSTEEGWWMNTVAINEQNEINKRGLILMTPQWSLKLIHSPSSVSRDGWKRRREEGTLLSEHIYCSFQGLLDLADISHWCVHAFFSFSASHVVFTLSQP